MLFDDKRQAARRALIGALGGWPGICCWPS